MGLFSRLRLFWTAGTGVVKGLDEASETANPLDLFDNWFRAAADSGILLPEAMGLATVGEDGRPSSRMVLLKKYGEQGFEFYTNYGSRKAHDLDARPHAALLFHWAVLQRQIRIEGRVERISTEESDRYFQTRARGSQIGAWASRQSEPIGSRAELEAQFSRIESRFEGQEVPLPEFWGGYRLVPSEIEFWQGRINRLHDRIRFTLRESVWQAERLYP